MATKKITQKIGISYGTSGMNGALFLHKNGKMYAIKSRSSSLFEYVSW